MASRRTGQAARRARAPGRARQARAALRQRKARLERLGARYLNRRAKSVPSVAADDPIHVLNPGERRALRRVQYGAVVRAFVVGAVSAAIVATAMVMFAPLRGEGEALSELALYWGLVVGVGVVTAMFEVAFMYWDSLRSVHRLACAAGLEIGDHDDEGDADERAAVAAALARAALELPNPPDAMFGVDPHRELSRFRVVLVTLVYKAKISLTNFLIKALVRRMLGRAGVRTWLTYLGVPVTAAWNGVVSWVVMREARIRVMGPSAALEYTTVILDREAELSPEGKVAVMRAVGCCIVSTRDFHPNLRALLTQLRRRLHVDDQKFDDREDFLTSLAELPRDEQVVVLRLLYVAAIIDGRVARRERRLLGRARAVCGLGPDTGALAQIRHSFVAGDPAPLEVIATIGARGD